MWKIFLKLHLAVLIAGFTIQLAVVYPVFLAVFSKVPFWILYAAIAEAMMVAFGTASSSATLPLTIACCEKRGISHKISSFVLPLLNVIVGVIAVPVYVYEDCTPLTPSISQDTGVIL